MTIEIKETIIAGGGLKDYATVRHLVLRGGQSDIGQHLATIAKDRHKIRMNPSIDPFFSRVNREYMQKQWPTHYKRMQGAAKAYGEDLQTDKFDFTELWQFSLPPGCSNIYYPDTSTTSGHAVLSRNYDLPICTEPYSNREPYLMEVYPDEGYPCLYNCNYDFLGTAIDGINSEGLTVALLADVETGLPIGDPDYPANCCYNYDGYMTYGSGIGLMGLQIPRFILETCKNIEEAKQALLTTMVHFDGIPLHFIVGDRHGNGFVYEGIMQGNIPRFNDCSGAPLPVTNHPLREHAILEHEMVQESVVRLERLRKRIASHKTPFDMNSIRANAESVAAVLPAGEGQYIGEDPSRTLWHAYYDLEERSLRINYFIRDAGDKASPDIHRSDELFFKLEY